MSTGSSDLSHYLEANAKWAVLRWEPMAGAGETLNVGALIEFNRRVSGHVLVRPEVLRCMFGSAGEKALTMIEFALKAAVDIAQPTDLSTAVEAPVLTNFAFGPVMETNADDVEDVIRQVISECCSLGALPSEPEEDEDTPPAEEREVQVQWTTRVRSIVLLEKPGLVRYFGRRAAIVDGGQPIKFGVLSPSFAAHFGLLRPNQQSQGMKAAKSKFWELSLAKERNPAITAALILGAPKPDYMLLSEQARQQLASNLGELRDEARQRNLRLEAVHTEQEAANIVMQMA